MQTINSLIFIHSLTLLTFVVPFSSHTKICLIFRVTRSTCFLQILVEFGFINIVFSIMIRLTYNCLSHSFNLTGTAGFILSLSENKKRFILFQCFLYRIHVLYFYLFSTEERFSVLLGRIPT